MTDLRKAAEMILKAKDIEELLLSKIILRQALAQDEQELVWCGCGDGIVANDEAMCGVCVMRLKDQIERMKAQLDRAPPSKPWVSLTDEEIEVNWQFLHGEEGSPPDHHDFARAIEAALKEKNHE